MADKRRLQGDIDRTLKRVHEGRSAFQEILDKFESASNHTQKEKFESDLKKEIKKLQRFRDQIKTWSTSNEIKDKRQLHDARKDIETDMERFKVIEKETKTKAYSKEGLVTETKRDPLQKEKDDMDEWVKLCINTFQERKEKTEFDIESFNSSKKKRNDRDKIQGLQIRLDIQQFHVDKLETILRLLDNELVSIDDIKGIKEVIEYYIEQSEDANDMDEESKTYYDELSLEELSDDAGAAAINPLAAGNAAPSAVPYLSENDALHKPPPPEPTEIATSRSSSPLQSVSSNVSGADSLSVSSSGVGSTSNNQENVTSSTNSTVLSRERRKSEEKCSSVNNSIHSTKSHGKSAGNTPLPYSGPINPPLSQLTTSGPVLNMSTVVAEIDNPNNLSASQPSVISHPLINSSSNGINSMSNVSSTTESAPVSTANYSASVTNQGIESTIDMKPKTPTPQVKAPQPIGQTNERDSPSIWQPAPPTSNLSSSLQASVRLIPNATAPSSLSPSASQQQQQQSLFSKPQSAIEAPQQNSMTNYHGPADLKAIAARQADSLLRQKPMNAPSFMPSSSMPSTQTQNSQPIITPEPQAIILDSKDAIAPFRNRQLHQQQEKIMPQIQALESGFKKLPHPGDTDRARMILYKVLPHSACPPYYPREPPKNADTEEYYMKLDPKTLFFIFYYFEGTKAQHLAAKALKRMSWRFHTKYMMWFQRHEEPKKITDEYESGTYIYYDIESMSQRKKENFMFEYAFLEDKDI